MRCKLLKYFRDHSLSGNNQQNVSLSAKYSVLINLTRKLASEGYTVTPIELKQASDRELARLLPAAAFVQLRESLQRLFEERLAGENNEHIKQGVRNEVARLDTMSVHYRKVVKARQHIEEEIQQMKCPRCREVVYDFEGCFAISCGGQYPCNFCGWCLSDCGDRHAAHAHVRICPPRDTVPSSSVKVF